MCHVLGQIHTARSSCTVAVSGWESGSSGHSGHVAGRPARQSASTAHFWTWPAADAILCGSDSAAIAKTPCAVPSVSCSIAVTCPGKFDHCLSRTFGTAHRSCPDRAAPARAPRTMRCPRGLPAGLADGRSLNAASCHAAPRARCPDRRACRTGHVVNSSEERFVRRERSRCQGCGL